MALPVAFLISEPVQTVVFYTDIARNLNSCCKNPPVIQDKHQKMNRNSVNLQFDGYLHSYVIIGEKRPDSDKKK